MNAPSMLEAPARPRRGGRFLIASAIVAPLGLLPWTCNLNVGQRHWAWTHAGPILCGPVALVLAAVALVRRGRGPLGGAGALALAVAALGAAMLAFGVLTVERVGSVPAGVAVDDAVRTVFERMRDDQYAAIIADGDPAIQGRADDLAALGHGFARGLGRWRDVSDTTSQLQDDLIEEKGTALYERGQARFDLTFRLHGGKPYLTYVQVEIPADHLPPPTDAAVAARRMTDDMMAGAIDRVHADVDPRIALTADFDKAVAQLHGQVRPTASVELVSQAPCATDQQCFELRIHEDGVVQRVRVTERNTFGIWLAYAVTLGDG